MKKKLFISHISEERGIAGQIKLALNRDFLGLLDVFVSSDTESIAAGADWLPSVDKALRDCAIFVILCSPESTRRPWINFEAGAAWMRDIPLIPICHSGLLPHDLPMPLSLKQGFVLDNTEGLQRLYAKVAEIVGCDVPSRSFADLAAELASKAREHNAPSAEAMRALDDRRGIGRRLTEALSHPKYRWRSLTRLAAEAAVPAEEAADLLRADPGVRFSRGVSKNIIVGLRSRVG